MTTTTSPSIESHLAGLSYLVFKLAIVFVFSISYINVAEAQLFRNFGKPRNPIPVVFNGVPTQQQLLQRLAAQTASVRQVDASVSVALEGAPKLKGTIQIERPMRLRLKAGVLGVDQMGVDVGSNDELFWIWTRVPIPGQPPTLMYAAHEQFKRSSGAVRQAIPLEPSWLINALGLVEPSANDFHQGPTLTPQGRLKLITVSDAPSGRQYRITLIDATRGLIEQQSIYDENRNLIAYTNSTGYKFYPEHNVSLPNKIEMHLYTADGQEQKLTVTTAGFNINSLFGDPQRMWTMPQPANVRTINLSQVGAQSAQPSQPTPQGQLQRQPQPPTLAPPQPNYRGVPVRPVSTGGNGFAAPNAAPNAAPYTTAAPAAASGSWRNGNARGPSNSSPSLQSPQSQTQLSPLR